jgi:hypothetical protein
MLHLTSISLSEWGHASLTDRGLPCEPTLWRECIAVAGGFEPATPTSRSNLPIYRIPLRVWYCELSQAHSMRW